MNWLTALRATACTLSECPSPTFGPFELLYVGNLRLEAWVQGVDSVGVTGIMVDSTPRYPALIVP